MVYRLDHIQCVILELLPRRPCCLVYRWILSNVVVWPGDKPLVNCTLAIFVYPAEGNENAKTITDDRARRVTEQQLTVERLLLYSCLSTNETLWYRLQSPVARKDVRAD